MVKHAKGEWPIYMLSDENIYHWMTWTYSHDKEMKKLIQSKWLQQYTYIL